MFSHDYNIARWPAGVRNNDRLVFIEECDFTDLLGSWIFTAALNVGKLPIEPHVHTKGCQAPFAGEIQNTVEFNFDLMDAFCRLGRRNRLPSRDVEPSFSERTVALRRGIQDIKTSIVPSTASATGAKRIATFSDYAP